MELKPVFSVSELNEYISLTLSHDPNLAKLQVQGEISGFHRHSTGHLFFTLKDAKASVECVMFKGSALMLKFIPKDGIKVKLSGQATLYQKDGSFRLIAERLDKLGEGELYARFIKLKEELKGLGYFDSINKKPIPKLPHCIGIVTSSTGAVLHDINNVLGRRFPLMPTVLYQTAVQGAAAAEEIAAAIRLANEDACCDVLIVGRGGGSLEDLWAFNEMDVANAIFNSDIPIISAVGHETDFTIADFVADLRAPTPSAAAELAVVEYCAVTTALEQCHSRLSNALGNGLDKKKSALQLMIGRSAFANINNALAQQRLSLDDSLVRITRIAADGLNQRRSVLNELGVRLEANSLGATLNRGFVLVTSNDGSVVSCAEGLKADQRLRLHFKDGCTDVAVQEG